MASLSSIPARWRAPGFLRRRGVPYVPGNSVEVLTDGGPFFGALVDAIGSASAYVYLETYIIVADKAGWRVAEALAARSRAGVEVALTYDGFGSFSVDTELIGFLRDAGVKILRYLPVSPLRGHWPWTKRNHRKMLVVDGRVGIVGGMNISDDYAAAEDGGQGWRDTAARIEGPAVQQLDAMFRHTWAQHARTPLSALPGIAPTFTPGHQARFLGNVGLRERADIRRDYLRAILRAQRTIRITAAYFNPDRILLRALRRATRRGVQVEVITAGATDVGAVLHASRHLYGGLLRAGVMIYEWHERVLHAKTAVIDGQWSTIGSANLNYRTWLKDLEVNVSMLGAATGGQMDDQFVLDRARARRIDLALWKARPIGARFLEWFFGLFRRLI